MRERIKAALAQKIDSKEKFDAFLREHQLNIKGDAGYYPRSLINFTLFRVTERVQFETATAVPEPLWWWVREALRESYGVYPPVSESSILTQLMSMTTTAAYFPHVSLDDPARIAVTMTAEDGARDKQTTIALGRWLRRVFPSMTDADIQAAEATHRAEMSNELEIVRTAEEIEVVYTEMRGDSGCMRYPRGHFRLKHHPSVVYSSPGFGVAVVRNGAGEVVARSVVYENPDDPQDKRYVRIYGDPSLKRRLERNGYRMAGTAGTVMDAYPVTSEENTYILPYLDPPGGNSSGVGDCRHVGVVLRGGKLHILGQVEYDKVAAALRARHLSGSYITGGSFTSARVTLRPLPEDLFNYRCIVTGQSYDATQYTAVTVWHDGQIGEANYEAVAGWVPARVAAPDTQRITRVLCAPDKLRFVHYGTHYIDTPETRHACGMVQLDATLYPEDREWRSKETVRVLRDGRAVRAEDCVLVQEHEGAWFRLKSEGDTSWVRLHKSRRYPGVAIYAIPDTPHGVTRSGTKVGLHTHDVVTLHGGTLEFHRNVKRIRLMAGAGYQYVHRAASVDELKQASIALLIARVNRDVDHYESIDEVPSHERAAGWVTAWTGAPFVHVETGTTWSNRRPDTLEDPIRDTLRNLEALAQCDEQTHRHLGASKSHMEVCLHVLRHARDRLDALEARLNPPQLVEDTLDVEPANERYVVAA